MINFIGSSDLRIGRFSGIFAQPGLAIPASDDHDFIP